jgi:hypothetical protein
MIIRQDKTPNIARRSVRELQEREVHTQIRRDTSDDQMPSIEELPKLSAYQKKRPTIP